MAIEEVVSQPFYSIKNKSVLLQLYQDTFNISLCDTCTSSYIKAYNELKKHVMANKKQPTQETPVAKQPSNRIKPEHINDTICIAGYGQVRLSDMSDDEINQHIASVDSLRHLLNDSQE
jgi:hypothetical protein